ncbi:MAG: hypothetical protein IJS96_03125, partial [Schwartzia sp.]|nr:hypothetical protein [Schwartzia sp. (in: firmicutes)]
MYLFPAFNQNCIIFTHDVHFPLPGADTGTRKNGEKPTLLSFFACSRIRPGKGKMDIGSENDAILVEGRKEIHHFPPCSS